MNINDNEIGLSNFVDRPYQSPPEGFACPAALTLPHLQKMDTYPTPFECHLKKIQCRFGSKLAKVFLECHCDFDIGEWASLAVAISECNLLKKKPKTHFNGIGK